MTPAEYHAWLLIGAGTILGLSSILLSKWLPSRRSKVVPTSKLAVALDTLRKPIQLPDGRWVHFQVKPVFYEATNRRAA